eukprot:jgi/Tetstr1/445815/TSEL_033456.t1
MESGDPAVAAMHPSYAATFDPSVYVRCAPRAGCPRSGHHVFHGARAAARAATCEFCNPPPPSTAPPPGVALPASAAGMRALQRQHAPALASAAQDTALAATARWCATRDVYRMMPRTPLRGTDVGSCPATLHVLFPVLDRQLAYGDRFPPTDDMSSCAALLPVSDAAAALHVLEGLHPPPAPTDPECSPPEEPPDLGRAPPLWGGNEDEDDPAAREERAKTGGPLRVRPLGVGSVFVRLASAHALVHVGADAREAVGSVAHAAWLEGIASVGTSGYGFDHGAMRLLVVCAVRQTGFLNRMMPPSELDPFLEAVDATNISAAFSLLGLDACDQSTPRMEAAIVQYE